MDLETESALSYYKEIAPLDGNPDVCLVTHRENGRVYVKKRVSRANRDVYLQLLEHPLPGLPRLYQIFDADDALILIEEYLSGETLQEILDREGTLPEDTVLTYGIELCRIVSGLHRCTPPIIHRDIKPSNLLAAPDGTLKLLDLDAARFVKNTGTAGRDTHLLGTVGYAAPEQYGFQASDTRTDVYSIGVLLNVLSVGEFPANRLAEGRLAPVLSRCTQLAPQDRYADAGALLDALLAVRDRRTLRRSSRRSRILTGIFCLFFFCLGLSMSWEGLSGVGLWANRIAITAAMLAVVLLVGNAGNIRNRLPLTRSDHIFLQILGLLLYAAAAVLLCAAALVTFGNIFHIQV